jgi:hypothetical protein
MSERLFAWLLRLYPSHFRKEYGDEALQLLLDRARDESGFFRTLRLWLDLLIDLAISIPREYRYAQPKLTGAVAPLRLDGAPSFVVFVGGSSRLGAFVFGGILSLAMLTMISAMAIHIEAAPAVRDSAFRNSASRILRSAPSGTAASQNREDSKQKSDAHGEPPVAMSETAEQNVASSAGRGTKGVAPLDAAERLRVIERVAANLKRFYFDREVAQKTAAALLVHEKNGDDDAATQGAVFADLLTAQMRAASHDLHLALEYSEDPLPEGPPAQTADDLERYRKAILQQNCMFRKVEMLPHNVGYLKLDFFPDASVCGSIARNAMTSLYDAHAVIFDLRDTTGGSEDMVSLLASYFFDHPEYMFSPRTAPTNDSWTLSPVPGNRLADKRLYVLTSSRTWSGAEQFCYDMKMLRRATLIGETTQGGAHVGAFHRIDDHFGMGIPEVKAINPFGKSDWEGVGVQPDVQVKAVDALETAKNLAERQLSMK